MWYLVAAYAAAWVIIFFYVCTLRSRQAGLEKTVEALLQRVGQAKQ
jgi:CcmD family protein